MINIGLLKKGGEKPSTQRTKCKAKIKAVKVLETIVALSFRSPLYNYSTS